MTLWINLDADNYQVAAQKGYLLKSKADPTQPCKVSWWNGTAGIVDLANPEARQWYVASSTDCREVRRPRLQVRHPLLRQRLRPRPPA